MRRLFFFCGLLFSFTMMSQSYVKQIPMGFQPISQAAIDAANADLAAASANSIYDIKMIFVTKMEGVSDRYQVYQGFGDDYLGFFNTPLEGDPANTDDPAVVHQQLLAAGQAELGSMGDYSMYIVYTTILKLTSNDVSYDQKKHVLYGANMTGCHKRRFEQIEDFGSKPTDYCVNNTIAVNDAYVSWYSGHLSDATESNYVITGTILFQGNIYCEEEYIYVNDQQEDEVTTQSPNTPAIKLLVNPNQTGVTVNWYDGTEDNATIFNTTNGPDATLAFYAPTYGQFNEVIANYGNGKSTSIFVKPINLQVTIDKTVTESHDLQPFTLTYYNNAIPFTSRENIDIHLGGSFTGAPDLLAAANENTIQWTPGEDVCDEQVLISTLRNEPVLANISIDTDVKIRCPFPFEGIEASVLYAGDIGNTGSEPQRIRKAEIDENLYIVRHPDNDNDDGKRDIRYDLKWEDDIEPEEDDFWNYGTATLADDDPKWDFGAASSTITKQMFRTEGGYAETVYDDHFPFIMATSVGGIAPNLIDYWSGGLTDQLEYPLSAEAFQISKNKTVYFLPQDKRKYDPLSPLIKKSLKNLNKIIKGTVDVLDVVGIKLEPYISVFGVMEHYNKEDPDSPGYYRYEKNTLTGQVGLQTQGFEELDPNGVPIQNQQGQQQYTQTLPPPLGFNASPVAKGGLFVSGKVFATPSFTKESRILNTTGVEELTEWSYKFGIGAQLDFGGTFEVLPGNDVVDANIKIYTTIPVGGEVEVSYHPQEPEEDQFQFDGQLYFGKITAKAKGGISFNVPLPGGNGVTLELLTINQDLGTLMERKEWPEDEE